MSTNIVDSSNNARKPFLWTPAVMATHAWYDADDLSTIVETGGFVSQWDDKSGNDRHLAQVGGGLQPLANKTVVLGGKNALYFNGANYLEMSGFGLTGDNALTVVAALTKGPAQTGPRTICQLGDDQQAPGGVVMGATSNSGLRYYYSTYVYYDPVLTIPGAEEGYLYSSQRAASADITDAKIFENGTEFTRIFFSSRPVNVVEDTFRVGAYYRDVDGFYYSKIVTNLGEMVVLNQADDATRQKVEGYLAHKWGLDANLPGGHPYKTTPPYLNS